MESEDAYHEALFLSGKGEYEKALDLLNKAIDADPEYWRFRYEKARCLHLLGRTEETEEILSEMKTQLKEVEIHRLYVACLMSRDDEAALIAVNECIDIFPEETDFLAHKADVLKSLGQYEKAEELVYEALERDVTNIVAHTSRARTFIDGGNYQEAMLEANLALYSDPQNLLAMCFRGIALCELGRAGEALDCFQQSGAMFPLYWHHTARCLLDLNRIDEAESALKNEKTFTAEDWYLMAEIYFEAGKDKEALRCNRLCVDCSIPEDWGAWTQYVLNLIIYSDLETAELAVVEMREKYKDETLIVAETRILSAMILIEQDKPYRRELKRAAKLCGGDDSLDFLLLYGKLIMYVNPESAKYALETAQDSYPNHPEITIWLEKCKVFLEDE